MTNTEKLMQDNFQHIVSDAHGIYSAQIFTEMIDFNTVSGIDSEGWGILEHGPDHPDYIDVWANELQNVFVTDKKGERFLIYENEGIYLYPEKIQDQINWDELN